MTYREIRDHKFKILFMYGIQNDISLDDIFLCYFDNLPYDDFAEEKNPNAYSVKHKSIYKKENIENGDIEILLDDNNINKIKLKLEKCIENIGKIDETISNNLKKRKFDRLAKTDLAILRLAVFEMYYDEDIDIKLAINEAVELAKVYSEERSDKFINGVLATIYRNNNEQ